jgi:hypothetical protein
MLDAVLQFQPYMFSRAFGLGMLRPTAVGNPAAIAHSIVWATREISLHATLANSVFCAAQLLIALGISWRPTVKVTLAVSVIWSFGVWWVGEGFGEVLTGRASPVTGAPGAVLIYAILAVLLWPRNRDTTGERPPFVAAQPFGATLARVVWAVLWLAMAYLALQAPNRAPDGVANQISRMGVGQPNWLATLDGHVAASLTGHGLVASIVLGALLVLFALGIFAPPRIVRAVLALAIAVSLVIWVVGEAFGGTLAGPATDPNSGLLLIVLAGTFWPLRPSAMPAPATASRTPAEAGT